MTVRSSQRARACWQLLKPRVMWLVGFSAAVGYLLALFESGQAYNPLTAVLILAMIALGAGSAGALNMWYEADIDAVMSRTQTRPIPSGRVGREFALGFAISCAVISTVTLFVLTNWVAATLLALTIGYYGWFYTVWLKPRTAQSIVIGGAAGAIPPVIGWVAAGVPLTLEPWLYFALIFVWTPPHFWALAIARRADYAKVNVPMLPNTKGVTATKATIFWYSIVLAAVALLPVFLGYAQWMYALVAIFAAGFFAWNCFRLYRPRHSMDESPMRVFAASILFLFIVLAAAVLDRWLAI